MTSSQFCLELPGPCSVLHGPCPVYTVRVAPRVNAATTVFCWFIGLVWNCNICPRRVLNLNSRVLV